MDKILIIVFFFTLNLSLAQVGIGTDSPTPGYKLDVAGSLLVQEEFKTTPFSDETAEYQNYKFLTRLLNSEPVGEVARLDLDNVNVAPINVFDYVFENFSYDNVTSVNLQFDADKYVVGLSNFRYEGRNIIKGGDDYLIIGNFVSRTYINPDTNTWHIEIRNRTRDTNVERNVVKYSVSLIVYDKRYFRQLPVINKDFRGNSTAEANSPL